MSIKLYIWETKMKYSFILIVFFPFNFSIQQIHSAQKLQGWRSDNSHVLGSAPTPRYQTCKASCNGKFYTFGGNGPSGSCTIRYS